MNTIIAESVSSEKPMDYDQFMRFNRYKVNNSLNKLMWFCILAGPAIALGIIAGTFKQTSYATCTIISVTMMIMAGLNMLILNEKPYSHVPGVLALAGMELLLCYMNASHISIRITWFLIPLLSLLFCDFRIYAGISILNYIMMGIGIWFEAPHYASIRTDFVSSTTAFINIFAGCTIEFILIFMAGYVLGRATNKYYRKMISQYADAIDQKRKMQEHLNIMTSMAEIYDYVNLIDINESTELSLRENSLYKTKIENDNKHIAITRALKNEIAADMIDDFWKFTDITTAPARLINRRIITGEFINNNTGWIRTQFIRVNGELDQKPDVIIFTIQNIDVDKRREEQLIRISMTDELTRVYNRRSYEKDMAEIQNENKYKGLSVISVDVNGLKKVNDSQGHSAGDELIQGTATCILSAVGSHGKVYRTGGDEFMVIAYDVDCKRLIDDIKSSSNAWNGSVIKEISLSAGYASHCDNPDATIEDLEKIADRKMYEDKARYYSEKGIDQKRY